MAKFFIVSEYTSSAQNSTGYFWEKAFNRLIDDGLQVEVITLERSTKDSVRRNILARALAKLRVASKLAWLTVSKARRGDIVFSGTNPETLLLILALFKNIFGFRLYVLVHDVFPENLIPAGVLTQRNPLYQAMKAVFDWVYAQPDKLFLIGRDMKSLVDQKTKRANRSVFVHNWVESEPIIPIKKSESGIIKDLNWENKTVFQFFGNIGRLQGISKILQAIELVKSPDAAFLFIGTGVESHRVVDFIKRNPGRHVHYFGSLPQVEKDTGLAACDVALIPLAAGMRGLGVPSKAYFSMAADRPILAVMDRGSEIALMVEEEQIGWTCPPGDPAEIAAKIDEICATDLSVYRDKVRHLALTKYSEASALNKLRDWVRA